MNKTPKEPKIQCRCSAEYKHNFDKYATKSGVSGSLIMREALDEFMEKYPDGAIFLKKNKSQDELEVMVQDMQKKLDLLKEQIKD